MGNWVLYTLCTYVLIVVILWIRFHWLGLKVRRYLWKNYPEKAIDFGCPLDGWFNGFKFGRALCKTHDIDDTEFILLKDKARKAQTLSILALLPSFLAIFLVFIIWVVS